MDKVTQQKFTAEDEAIMIYALGALHHAVFLGQANPVAIGIAKSSVPLCKKLGLGVDESLFERYERRD